MRGTREVQLAWAVSHGDDTVNDRCTTTVNLGETLVLSTCLRGSSASAAPGCGRWSDNKTGAEQGT